MLGQGCANSCRLIARGTKFVKVAINSAKLLSLFVMTYKIVCHCACAEQKAPDNGELHRSLQKFGSLVGKLIHVGRCNFETAADLFSDLLLSGCENVESIPRNHLSVCKGVLWGYR